MQKFHNETQFILTPAFCITSALMFLILPLRWVLSWFVASIIHELCHFCMLALFRIPVYSVVISAGGAMMQTGPMGHKEEFFSAISGPVGSLIILFFARYFPLISACAFVQSVYNLLPIYPLDGGRAVMCLLTGLIKDPFGIRIYRFVEISTMIILCVICFYTTFILKLGYIPTVVAIVLFLKANQQKQLANHGFSEYNSLIRFKEV